MSKALAVNWACHPAYVGRASLTRFNPCWLKDDQLPHRADLAVHTEIISSSRKRCFQWDCAVAVTARVTGWDFAFFADDLEPITLTYEPKMNSRGRTRWKTLPRQVCGWSGNSHSNNIFKKVPTGMHYNLRLSDVELLVLGCFWPNLYCTCADTTISKLPVKILTWSFDSSSS